VRAWEPTWSPEVALADYAGESTAFENGEYKICPPFSGCEEYDFPQPVGPVVICQYVDKLVNLAGFTNKNK